MQKELRIPLLKSVTKGGLIEMAQVIDMGVEGDCVQGTREDSQNLLARTSLISITSQDRTQEGKRQQMCDRNKTTLLFRIMDTL